MEQIDRFTSMNTSDSNLVSTFEVMPSKHAYKCPACGKKVRLISEISVLNFIKKDKGTYLAQCECKCGWSSPLAGGKTRKKAIKKGKKLAKRCAKKWGSKK